MAAVLGVESFVLLVVVGTDFLVHEAITSNTNKAITDSFCIQYILS